MMSTIGPSVLVLVGTVLLALASRRPGRRAGRARHLLSGLRWLRAVGSSVPQAMSTARRHREMEADVPEVLDVLRATIAAGVAPRRALQAAAESSPPSLTVVLGEAVAACEFGSGAGKALAEAGRAHRLTELMVAGEALDLSELTGAPPGGVLAGVALAAAKRARGRRARPASRSPRLEIAGQRRPGDAVSAGRGSPGPDSPVGSPRSRATTPRAASGSPAVPPFPPSEARPRRRTG